MALTTNQMRSLLGLPPVPDGSIGSGSDQRSLLTYSGPFTSTTATVATPVHDLGLITLLDLTLNPYLNPVTYYYSNFYHDLFTTYYPRLLNHAQISLSLPDLFNGTPGIQSAQVSGVNLHAENTEAPSLGYILTNIGEVLGAKARVRLYSITLEQTIMELNGFVSDYEDGESEWTITVETEESSIFDIELPVRRLRDIYPDMDLTSGKGQDPPPIVVHGTMRRVPLFLVESELDPYSADVIHYRYGAIRSPEAGTLTVANVYRDGALVDESEYTVIESPVGYTVIQFDLDQRDASGRSLPILVDLISSEFDGNPARVVKFWLTDPNYGLGQLVDNALQDIAEIDYIGLGMQISGGVNELTNAKVLFSQLLLHGAYFALNESGEYYTIVDTDNKHPLAADDVFQLGLNDGGGWLNIRTLENQFHRRTDEMFKSLLMKGVWDNGFESNNAAFLATASRARSSQGIAKEIENPQIGDVATLEREIDYLFKRYNAQDRGLSVVSTTESYVIDLGTLVKVTIPHKAINGIVYEVRGKGSLGGQDAGFQLLLSQYNSNAFVYEPGTPVVSSLATVLTNYHRTNPEEPTGFEVVTSVVQTGTEGIVESLVRLRADAPSVNVTHLVFQSFRAGSAIPRSEVTVAVDPGDVDVHAELALTPGLTYDLECYALNVDNDADRQESTRAQILNHTAVGDTQAPNPPTALIVTHGTGRTLSIDWADNTEEDFKYYEIWRDTVGTFATAVKLADVSASRFVDQSIVYDTNYFYHVRAVDHSGNMSLYSNTGVGFVGKLSAGDYGSGSVHTEHRQPLNLIFFAFAIDPHTSFSQNTGIDSNGFLETAGVTPGVQATDEWNSSTYTGGNPNGTRLFFIFAAGFEVGSFDENYHLGFWNGTPDTWVGGGRINGW